MPASGVEKHRDEALHKRLEELVNIFMLESGPGSSHGAIARDNAALRQRFLDTERCLTSREVHEQAGSRSRNVSQIANAWKRKGRVLSVPSQGTTSTRAFGACGEGWCSALRSWKRKGERAAMTAPQATLLGGSGFIGRALTARLLAEGWRVRVVARSACAANLPEGAAPMQADVGDAAAMAEAMTGSRAVVYLPGLVQAARPADYHALHCAAPKRCAERAQGAGVRAFVFVSALGAARDAPALADRTKAEGEAAVRSAFPASTIVRPSLVYGPNDHFVSGTARMLRSLPVFPLIGGGRTRFQPLHLDAMTDALAALVTEAAPGGRTWELGGDAVYSLRALVGMIRKAAGLRSRLVSLPFPLAMILATALESLPNPPLIRDQVRLLRTDKIVSDRYPTLHELGVDPRAFEDHLPALVRAALEEA